MEKESSNKSKKSGKSSRIIKSGKSGRKRIYVTRTGKCFKEILENKMLFKGGREMDQKECATPVWRSRSYVKFRPSVHLGSKLRPSARILETLFTLLMKIRETIKCGSYSDGNRFDSRPGTGNLDKRFSSFYHFFLSSCGLKVNQERYFHTTQHSHLSHLPCLTD